MWAAQTSIRTAPPARGIRDAVCALRRAEEFKKASRALRKASRQARRDWFEARITEAEHAAARHDIGEVYRIINLLAPKQRREAVRIKSAEGSLLDPKAEFEEIFEYYQSVFNRDVPFELVTQPVVQFEHSEILDSVRKLKGGRAVPPKSVPSELWSLCAEEYAAFLTPRLNLAESQESQYPPEATDCTLALLMQYLGIIASYDGFELQTCLHRRSVKAVPETMPLQSRFEDPAFQSAVLKDWLLLLSWLSLKAIMADAQMEESLSAQARQELEMVFSGRPSEDKSEKEKEKEDAQEPEDGRRPKWRRDESKGKGPSSNSWENWSQGKRRWSEQQKSKESSKAEDPQTQELLRCLVKMSVRHEQELMRIRPDVGFIAFCDTSDLGCMGMLREVALSWSDLFSQGKVNTALKTMLVMSMMKDMKERAENVLREEDQLQRCFTVGWLKEGATGLDPVWVYHTWNAKEKKQEVASTPPLKHSDVLKLLDVLLEHLPRDGVVTRFNTTKRLDLMKEFKTEVVPMMLQLSLRGASAQLCYDAMKALSGNAAMKLQGVRWRPERAQKPPLAKALEEAYLATSFCDWAPRDQSWARR
ncbi:hypothetical protein AK812_SmicGene34756 [Symbiodinium microadriaticum]|uniref:Uncharacterized protein n=1 Tax=Symbiodinium microadriaticum TaxID=2951 RepID=A0A1Q9CND8_SYMMI|nr:hypothetical protein AK812_SmicGene34756 [Symbiodinium microadriaticum]